MPVPTSRAWLQIHFCVLLWGFTAILGRLISLPAPALVWWRMLLVSAALWGVPRVWRGLGALPWTLIATYAGIGVLVALHWLAFYAAIKLSNASVAATCIAMGSVFLAVLEPLLTTRRFKASELMVGAAVMPAVALVVGGTPDQMQVGIAVGIAAAALVAVFGSLNKRFIDRADALTITCIEMSAGVVFLSVVGPLVMDRPVFVWPGPQDAILLVTLALACTLLPFALSLVALRELTAFGAQLAVSLEPVYAILLAIPILHEQRELTPQFYAGVAGIVGIVFLYPAISRRGDAAAKGW